MSNLPLVSCIMPTKDRPEFAAKAIEYFNRQTYPNKRLVIGDETLHASSGSSASLITWLQSPTGFTMGAKRNWLVERAPSDLIAHWDDDDWYGPLRLALQMQAMQEQKADICGLDCPRFYDLASGNTYRYQTNRPYVFSPTLMYTRDFWRRIPFPDVQVGATTSFVWPESDPHRLDHAAILPDADWFVGIAHDTNNSTKNFSHAEFKRWPSVQNVLGADWDFYQSLRVKMGAAR